MSMSVNDDVL